MSRPAPPLEVPVNRALVGILSLLCLGTAGAMAFVTLEGPAALWQGAFFRVGVVLAAFWLALPTRTREAAWARVSIWKLAGALLVLLVIARTRVPLKLLLPGVLLFGIALAVLRPRRKTRPAQRLFD